MSHKDNRQLALLLLLAQQDQNLDLHRGVQRGGRLIRQQQLRVARQRQSNHRPLAHTAGHFVRVGVQPPFRTGDPHLAQRLQSPFPRRLTRQPFMTTQTFDDLLADGIHRIKGQQRLLKNHRATGAAIGPQPGSAHLQHLLIADAQRPREHAACGRMQAHQRPQGDAFTGPRLPDQRHHFPFMDIKRDAVNRIHRLTIAAKLHPQIADMNKSLMRHG